MVMVRGGRPAVPCKLRRPCLLAIHASPTKPAGGKLPVPKFCKSSSPNICVLQKKTDIVLALGKFSAQRHGPRALLYIDLYPACTVNNSFPLIYIML